MNKLIQYLKETRNELKEVVFPTTSQTITYTVLVIVISIIVAVLLGGVDLGLRSLLRAVVNR
jgi:preprotein translocase subunit SecE